MGRKSQICSCGADHTTSDSVYRLLNVTGHLEDGNFREDDSADGDGTIFCVACDKPIEGV